MARRGERTAEASANSSSASVISASEWTVELSMSTVTSPQLGLARSSPADEEDERPGEVAGGEPLRQDRPPEDHDRDATRVASFTNDHHPSSRARRDVLRRGVPEELEAELLDAGDHGAERVLCTTRRRDVVIQISHGSSSGTRSSLPAHMPMSPPVTG